MNLVLVSTPFYQLSARPGLRHFNGVSPSSAKVTNFNPFTKVPIVNQLISNFAKMITLLRTPTLKSLILIMSVVTVPGGVEVYNLCDFYYYYYYFYLLSRDRRLSKPVNQF